MKSKILNVCLILTSLGGYLEWGKNNKMFLFRGEILVISKLLNDPGSALHPFTLLPLIGQVLLVITLFQKSPSRLLTFLGLSGISVLLILMFAIGLLSLNVKITLSTLPFLVTGFIVMKHRWAPRSGTKE
jgi:hypothetical protein